MNEKTLTPMHNEAGELVGYKARTTKETLIAAKAAIDTPDKWHRGDWANASRDCFCAMGAIAKVSNVDFELLNDINGIDTFANSVLNNPATIKLASVIDGEISSIPMFNDDPDTTHAAMMETFDRAIAKA